jgi:hypothetical protein
MNPVTHFLVGWTVANGAALDRRSRALVTLAGVAPDLDGLGIVPEILTRGSSHPLPWFTEYHHLLGHNIGLAAVVTAASAFLARTGRWKTALLAAVSFHLHLICDVLGARGPDGYQWPIPYLLPFSSRGQWLWTGQWALNAWPNFVLTITLLLWTFWFAWSAGRSPLEMFSLAADTGFVAALRGRFPRPLARPNGDGLDGSEDYR